MLQSKERTRSKCTSKSLGALRKNLIKFSPEFSRPGKEQESTFLLKGMLATRSNPIGLSSGLRTLEAFKLRTKSLNFCSKRTLSKLRTSQISESLFRSRKMPDSIKKQRKPSSRGTRALIKFRVS